MSFQLHQSNIDFKDQQFATFFSSIQGNILKGHGRDHTTNIFIAFKAEKQAEAKKWIAGFTEDNVTTMMTQMIETEKYKATSKPGGLFASLYLSGSGYDFLGFDSTRFDPAFSAGMKAAGTRLKDTPESFWDPGFRGKIHMLVLLADNDQKRMAELSKSLLADLVEIADIKTVEYGHAIRDKNGVGLEHNGYADGISQPLFLKGDITKFKEDNPGPLVYDPTAELDLVLLKDPFGPNEEDFGSFFVFRKLEQNVRGFKHEEEKVLVHKLTEAAHTAHLHFGDEDSDRAGAMVVGRYEDGSPITISKFNNLPGASSFNNFDYSQDVDGAKCPFHAHIRKANPRREGDKAHVMARRGIPFGQRDVPTETDPSAEQSPTGGVGLLFMSYQQSLTNQFEFIQTNWINNPDFPATASGADPVIGEDPVGAPHQFISKGKFPIEYNNKVKENFVTEDFHSFVKLKGGEYFFSPSIAFLKNL